MSYQMVILAVNSDNTIKCYREGIEVNAVPAEDLNTEEIPLNGIGLIDVIGGTNFLVGYKNVPPFQSFLKVHGGA